MGLLRWTLSQYWLFGIFKLKFSFTRPQSKYISQTPFVTMAKFDGIKGQELLDVEEDRQKNEITLIFKDNRFLFVKVEDGKLVCDSVPE